MPSSANFYWIQSGESILIDERVLATKDKYPQAQKKSIGASSQVDWSQLSLDITAQDMFAAQNLWHINFFDQLPDKQATEFIRNLDGRYLSITHSMDPETIVIVSSGILTAAQRKTKWYKNLNSRAGIEILWPMNEGAQSSWIQKRMSKYRLQFDKEALVYLVAHAEGNLSILDKELYKLSLFATAEERREEKIQNIDLALLQKNLEGDHSRYSAFDLLGTALLQPMDRFVKLVNYFENEGHDINQTLGALRFSLVQLLGFSQAGDGSHSAALNYLPPSQKSQTQACLIRYNSSLLTQFLLDLSEVDKSARGISSLSPWGRLLAWALKIRQRYSQHRNSSR